MIYEKIEEFANKISSAAKPNNWSPYKIVKKSRWNLYKQSYKASEKNTGEEEKLIQQRSGKTKENTKHIIQFSQEKSALDKEILPTKTISIRKDSGYGEDASDLKTNSGSTTCSVSGEFKSLQKRKEIENLQKQLHDLQRERDARPNITIQKWEKFQDQIDNIQVDLTKAKNAIAENAENFSEITSDCWESVQKKITDLKKIFWCSTTEQNITDNEKQERVPSEEKINVIYKNYLIMHQTRLREENLPAGINELRREVIGQIKEKLERERDDLLSFEVKNTDYENEISQFSENNIVITKGKEIFTLMSTFEGLIKVNNFLKEGNFDLINETTENSWEDNEETALGNYGWENKDWSRWNFLKKNLKVGVDANKPLISFLEEDHSSSSLSSSSVSPKLSPESDLSEVEETENTQRQTGDNFSKEYNFAKTEKEKNKILWLENERVGGEVETLKEQLEDLKRKANKGRRLNESLDIDINSLVEEKNDLFTEGKEKAEDLRNLIAEKQKKITKLEEENKNQGLENELNNNIIREKNEALTRKLGAERTKIIQHELEINNLNLRIIELEQIIEEISTCSEERINELKELCEELEEKLEEERTTVEIINQSVAAQGIEWLPLGEKAPNLMEQLNEKIRSRSSSLNLLKDKISSFSNNSSRTSSNSHSRDQSEETQKFSIVTSPDNFTTSPSNFSENQGSYFGQQKSQDLVRERVNELEEIKGQLKVVEEKLLEAEKKRDKSREESNKWMKKTDDFFPSLNKAKKEIKKLKKEIKRLNGVGNGISANQRNNNNLDNKEIDSLSLTTEAFIVHNNK